MPPLHLLPLDLARCDLIAADPLAALPGCVVAEDAALVSAVAEATAAMMRATAATPPWIGYLALRDGAPVGTCAFKAPPAGGEVEIAYFTFPSQERRGHGRAMAAELVRIACAAPEVTRIVAETRAEANASTAILAGLGFRHAGSGQRPEAGATWRWALARPGA